MRYESKKKTMAGYRRRNAYWARQKKVERLMRRVDTAEAALRAELLAVNVVVTPKVLKQMIEVLRARDWAEWVERNLAKQHQLDIAATQGRRVWDREAAGAERLIRALQGLLRNIGEARRTFAEQQQQQQQDC